jgi:WD40 repeat protein
VTCLAFNRDGSILASGDSKGRIKIWQVGLEYAHGCEFIDCMPEGTHTGAILALAYSDDSSSFYSISADLTMKYWDIENSKMYNTRYFGSQGLFALCAAFSSDKRTAVIGADDLSVRVIVTGAIDAGTELYKFFTHGSVSSVISIAAAVEEDGKEKMHIVCGGEHTFIWAFSFLIIHFYF